MPGVATGTSMSESNAGRPELARAVVSNTGDAILLTDRGMAIQYVTPSTERVLGHDASTLVGGSLAAHVHSEDVPDLEATLDDVVGRAGPDRDRVSVRVQRADGRWLPLSLTVTECREAGVDGFVLNARPVERERRVAAAFEELVAQTPTMLTVLDDAAVVRFVSPPVEEMLGCEAGTVIGTHVGEHVHPDDVAGLVRTVRDSLSEPGDEATVEFRCRTADDEWRWLEARGRRTTADLPFDGDILLTSRDITERKERERDLRAKNEQLDQFTSVVSHDLRNPISVLRGSLELARETGDEDHLERAEKCVDRMDTLVDDLLTMARQGEVDPETTAVELDEAAPSAWRMVETGEISLTVRGDHPVPADPDMLREVFENLFRNSVEHGGSTTEVTVARTNWGFVVEDDGTGFDGDPEAALEPGYTTSEDGTGFGLSIVDTIADAHGWSFIPTESSEGGARFEFVTEGGPSR